MGTMMLIQILTLTYLMLTVFIHGICALKLIYRTLYIIIFMIYDVSMCIFFFSKLNFHIKETIQNDYYNVRSTCNVIAKS